MKRILSGKKGKTAVLLAALVIVCMAGISALRAMPEKGNGNGTKAQHADGRNGTESGQEPDENSAGAKGGKTGLAGGGAEEAKVQMLRVREKKIADIDGDWNCIWVVGEQPRILTMRNDLAIWDPEDGSLEKQVECPEVDGSWVVYGFLDRAGDIWAVCQDPAEQGCSLMRYDGESGAFAERITLSREGEDVPWKSFQIWAAYADESWIYLIGRQNEEYYLAVYDRMGSFADSRKDVRDFAWIGEGDILAYEKAAGNRISEIQVSDGKLSAENVWNIELEGTAGRMRYDADQRTAYFLLAGRIVRMRMDGEEGEAETLLNLSANALEASGQHSPADFFVNGDGSICVLYNVFGGEAIGKEIYRYDFYEKEDAEETLTVTLPHRMDIVDTAVLLYEEKYPDRTVEVETFYEDEAQYLEYSAAYAEKMAARVMAGDYGDILLSSYGVYSMEIMGTDAFLDLSDWIQSAENYEDLDQGMLEAAKVQGALRGVPVALGHSYYIANEQMAEAADKDRDGYLSWTELLDQALLWDARGERENYLFGQPWQFSLVEMLNVNIPDLIDPAEKTMELEQEWFLELMRKWKQVSRLPQAAAPEMPIDPDSSHLFAIGLDRGAMLAQVQHISRGHATGSMEKDAQKFCRDEAACGSSLTMLKGIRGEKNRNLTDFPRLFFSVNPAGENRESALDFLEVLLSEKVQERLDYSLIPVSKKAWYERLVRAKESGAPVSDEELERFYHLLEGTCEQIDGLYSYSFYLEDLLEAMEAYVRDELTLEQAISQAEEKIRLRMYE